jgi:threonine/homoserine/homoserine lactone efflux protein
VLPAALGMAGVIVLFDVLVYGTVAIVVDRFREVIRPHGMRRLSQASGAVLVLFGLRLAREAR